METIIEEGIYNIESKLPLRRVVFNCDGKKITRELFILGDDEYWNNKVDIIDLEKVKIEIDLSKINNSTPIEIGNFLKEKAQELEPNYIIGEVPDHAWVKQEEQNDDDDY